MSKATDELLDLLHGELAKEFLRRIKDGTATAAFREAVLAVSTATIPIMAPAVAAAGAIQTLRSTLVTLVRLLRGPS